ncbi:hypothetical protein MD588_05440 [Photobacterium sp. SDRW27]|uniref:hypothetical protein n=1 Tax=Photobacterium obscurum TaxID=2829490 RepID=UPI002244C904|nr:hypothetical protein [Photobacterium obscurum]MCW8328247.1 hypothetical protein [Photobacterium obscurum]
MTDFISLRALSHHLQADNGDPASLVHLVALGAQSGELLHRLKASGEPLGSLPSPRLQCELSLYAQQRFSVLSQSTHRYPLLNAVRQWRFTRPCWEPILGTSLLSTCPELPLLVYYLDVSDHLLNHSPTSIEERWQQHLNRTVSFMAVQVLIESGMWDEIYISRDGVMALDHQAKGRLLLSETQQDINQREYAQEWRQLSPHFILQTMVDSL